jgi:hypothetical protein
MVDRQQAQQIAGLKASALLLEGVGQEGEPRAGAVAGVRTGSAWRRFVPRLRHPGMRAGPALRQTHHRCSHIPGPHPLLEEYEVEVADETERWIVTYIPRARVRGGGFQLSISKATGEIAGVVRFQ